MHPNRFLIANESNSQQSYEVLAIIFCPKPIIFCLKPIIYPVQYQDLSID